jgi:site-specific recombinase XerC
VDELTSGAGESPLDELTYPDESELHELLARVAAEDAEQVRELTSELVQRWVSEQHEHYAPGTVARRLTALRSWYGWLADEGVVHASPAARVRLLVRVPSRVPSAGLTLEQAQQLLRTAAAGNRRDALVIGLLLLMGLRASEVGDLNADGVRHERGHLLLTVHGKGGPVAGAAHRRAGVQGGRAAAGAPARAAARGGDARAAGGRAAPPGAGSRKAREPGDDATL